MTVVSELRSSRELLVNLTLREVRGKYKRTALGQGWSLVNPLATMVIFTVVFGLVLGVKAPHGHPSGLRVFALWLVCGLLPWTFFQNALTGAMGALLGNANLIKKVYFPREILVTSVVLSWDVSFLIELVVLSVVLMLFGAFVLPWLPLVIVFTAVLTLFALGIGLALSVANVYFRDTSHFVNIFMQLWFYATPIVYPPTLVAHKLTPHKIGPINAFDIYRLNPLERFVEVFRSLLYDNRLPGLVNTVFVVVATAVVLVVGYWLFRRYEGRLAEEL